MTPEQIKLESRLNAENFSSHQRQSTITLDGNNLAIAIGDIYDCPNNFDVEQGTQLTCKLSINFKEIKFA